jgi:hypothetical protein
MLKFCNIIIKSDTDVQEMANITIKGKEYAPLNITDAYNRRAVQYQNKIVGTLKLIGVSENNIDVSQEAAAFKKAPAYVSWHMDKRFMYYSWRKCGKFVENLDIVFKVIKQEVGLLIEGKKSYEEFIAEFEEDPDVVDTRKEACDLLGVDQDTVDMELIDKAYKNLAKKHHPDKETGDAEQFKRINNAHKILRRELD